MNNGDILMYADQLDIIENYMLVTEDELYEVVNSNDYFNCIDEENCINKVETFEEQNIDANTYFDCVNEIVADNCIQDIEYLVQPTCVTIGAKKRYVLPIFILGSIALNFYPNVF